MAAAVSLVDMNAGAAGVDPRAWPELAQDRGAPRIWLGATWWSFAQGAWTRADPGEGLWSGPIALSPEGRERALYLLAASGGRAVASLEGGEAWYLFSRDSGVLLAQRLEQGHAPNLPAPAPQVVLRAHPKGPGGLKRGLDVVASMAREDALDPLVIAHVRRTIHAATESGQIRAARGNPDPNELAQVLYAEQKKRCAFVKDTRQAEVIFRTRYLLCLDPSSPYCARGGDCEEQVLAFVSQMLACGIRAGLRQRWYKGWPEVHLTAFYDASRAGKGQFVFVGFDPSSESGRLTDIPHIKEESMEVTLMSPDAIPFVGMGALPFGDDALAVATMGATTDLMPAELAASMLQWLAGEKESLSSALDKSQRFAQALAQTRADLGYPVNDNPSSPQSSGSPLDDYEAAVRSQVADPPWTLAAQQDLDRLHQTASFMMQGMAEAVSGKRPVYFHDGDLLVGALPGDALQINWTVDASGKKIPTYVDPQTQQPIGTMGDIPVPILPIVYAFPIGGSIVLADIMSNVADLMHINLGQLVQKATQSVVSTVLPPDQQKKVVDAVVKVADAAAGTPKAIAEAISGWLIALALVGGLVLGVAVDRALSMYLPRAGELVRLAGAAGGSTKRLKAAEPRATRRRRPRGLLARVA